MNSLSAQVDFESNSTLYDLDEIQSPRDTTDTSPSFMEERYKRTPSTDSNVMTLKTRLHIKSERKTQRYHKLRKLLQELRQESCDYPEEVLLDIDKMLSDLNVDIPSIIPNDFE